MLPRDPVAAVRRFNRFYTAAFGGLDAARLQPAHSPAEMRVLYEIAQAPEGITPKALAAQAGMDPGYLSRVLKRFEAQGLIQRQADPKDRRSVSVWLSSEGIRAYNGWLGASQDAAEALIAPLTSAQKAKLVRAMAEIEALLGA
jgi:DNA-binding MarR family transcriptional regulator